jgi:hypothetical protein
MEGIMHRFIFLVMLLAAPVFAQDQATDLRTAAGCGPTKTQFDVKVDKKQHSVAQSESGKALVYVIEEYKSDPHFRTIGHVTTRAGLDGNWVGATHEGSYISFLVEPGAHRLCSDVQSMFAAALKLSEAVQLNAEAGKTYYYRVAVVDEHKQQTQLWVKAMDEPEGLLMVSKSGQSNWKVKK